jgi:hypothetical protein
MPSVIDDPHHWHKRAAEAFAVANQMADSEAKHSMLGIAEGYERLARRAEERTAQRLPHSK